MEQTFSPSTIEKNFFVDSVAASKRGKAFSVTDMFGSKTTKAFIGDARLHDTNFAFLTTTLSKLHNTLYEPKYFVTYAQDIPVDVGGGFVDYVSYYTVDWAGIIVYGTKRAELISALPNRTSSPYRKLINGGS